MMKKSIFFVLRGCVLASLAVVSAANATQTVQPVKDTAGTAFGAGANATSWATSAGLGTVVTVIGRYTTDNAGGSESGLGLKVKYDETKFAANSVSVTALSTKCMIAAPQLQPAGANSLAVLGWIDTATRTPAGSVGWPYAADPASPNGCLNPNTPANDTTATASGAVNLFRFQGTLLSSLAVGTTTDVVITADGNYSYAATSPALAGMADQKVTITAAPAPACNLDVDASGSVLPFGDGIMILRHMLGLSGTALNAGVTGTPDPLAVANRITAMGLALDVDGDGSVLPFRDGILLIRMMLGLTGTALTAGVPTTAPRNSAAAYVGYVNSTCGTNYQP
jgi:hypothetical protein